MKNFTLLLIAFFSVTVVYAQNASYSVPGNLLPTPKMTFENSLPRHLPLSNAGEKKASPRTGEVYYMFGNSEYDSIYDWRLQSPFTKWNYAYKYIDMAYDANNNLTNFVELLWDTTKWENYVHYSYTFNAANLETNATDQSWNDTTGWVNNFELINTYNSNNKEITSVDKEWEDTGWVPFQKDTFAYNPFDSISNEILETWVDTAWEPFYQQVRSYNSDNLPDTILVQGANDGGPWSNSLLFTYSYHLDTTFELDQNWLNSAWANADSYTDVYNTDGYVTSDLTQTSNGSTWTNYSFDQYTYNSDNYNTSSLIQLWQSNTWLNIERTFYNYDADNLDTSAISQIYYTSWENSGKTINRYNSNSVEVLSVSYSYNGQSAGDTLVNRDSTIFYPAGSAGINVLNDNSAIQLYPNPSSDFIHTNIQLNQPSDLQLRLVNMPGQTVWSVDAGHVSSYQNGISVADLADGVYLLEMVTGGGVETKEVVVQK